MNILRKMFHNQFVIFLFTGGIAALVNFVSRIILNLWISFEASVVIAYIIGMVVAYLLFRKIVFKKDVPIIKSSIKFVIVNIVGIILTYYVSVYMYFILKNYDIMFVKEISHFVGISVPAISSFIGHKYFSFKN